MLLVLSLLGLIATSYIRAYLLAIVIVLELVLLVVILGSIAHYMLLNELLAQLIVVLMITLAGAETSCALSLIVMHYMHLSTIELNN